MSKLTFFYNDGGRAAAGYKGSSRDCGCRALAIATGMPYKQAYDLINSFAVAERIGKLKKGKSSARTGVYGNTMRKIMATLGWSWVPCMGIGTGCKVHLAAGELPMGRIIVLVSRHYTTVIDGVVNDTYDPQRDSGRCVYGFWTI